MNVSILGEIIKQFNENGWVNDCDSTCMLGKSGPGYNNLYRTGQFVGILANKLLIFKNIYDIRCREIRKTDKKKVYMLPFIYNDTITYII